MYTIYEPEKETVYRSVSRIGNALKSVLMNSRAFPGLGRATPRPRRERRCAGGKSAPNYGGQRAAVLRCFTVPDHGQNPKNLITPLGMFRVPCLI